MSVIDSLPAAGWLNFFNAVLFQRSSGGNRDPWRLGKRETVHNATLSPPE